jgi:uncharacterized iron-regulated membrane protein
MEDLRGVKYMEITDLIFAFLAAMGIPSAITGLLMWWFKRRLDKTEAAREDREKNTEKLMLMIMQNGRAAVVLAEATARAVQRIPDAHCNGDMTAALERAEQIQKEEQDFLLDQGVQHIFGNK